jgi:hypothetical protein
LVLGFGQKVYLTVSHLTHSSEQEDSRNAHT